MGVESGRLPGVYLAAPSGPAAGLLELSQQRGCPAAVRERLLAIRQQILHPVDLPSQDAVNKARTLQLQEVAYERLVAARVCRNRPHAGQTNTTEESVR